MSKPQFEKIKRHLSSSSNLTLSNHTILTSTLGKLLVRKLTHRSPTDATKSTSDLSSGQHYEQPNSSTMDTKMILKDNLKFIERIGQGKLGVVLKAFYRTKQNELLTVAVKKLDLKFHYNDILKDVNVLQEIKHPYILQFFGITIHTDRSILFIMEYAPMKSLDDCLISPNAKREYTVQILFEFIKQIAAALSYLEKRFFIHRNLTCRNYLVFNKSLVKLSDWSFGHLNASWKERLKLPIAWMSPEAIHSHCFSIASDVYSFGVSMWECFSYGQVPWQGMTNDQISEVIDASNYQQLPRPSHATSELYQLMLHCWKYEPCERPTFSELEMTLAEIELEQVQWKNNHNTSINLPDNFLSIQSCLLEPLTILDRWYVHQITTTNFVMMSLRIDIDILERNILDIPSSSSSIKNFIQCVTVDGQIGFVYISDVEPLHTQAPSKQTINSSPATMNHIFSRKTGIKKNSTKTRCKHLSKDMISSPQADFIHAFHLGVEGEAFGDISCLSKIEDADLDIQFASKNSTDTSIEQRSTPDQSSSLFDEVMQAFTEIYSEPETTSVHEDHQLTRSASPQSLPADQIEPSSSYDINQFLSDDMTDSNNRSSPSFSRLLSKLNVKKPNEKTCRFTRELEERSRTGNLSEQGKSAYNLLINRCTSNSSSQSSTHDDHSSSSVSSHHEKLDFHSHYSSRSSLNSRASSLNKAEQHSATGQPLPPPPDLTTLGSKLTTANMTNTFKLPVSLVANKYSTKKRFNLFT
ncbi:unnamed protein product [Adineta ricciae]|uniref:Uncharacterized protein n=1 Tax=Adineta ricciae TaxID=249248 RepID=A0A814MVF2_ADIRI|nr:unnamed protein product [Adineta ricciae]